MISWYWLAGSWAFFIAVIIWLAINRGATRAVALLDALALPEQARSELKRRHGLQTDTEMDVMIWWRKQQ